MIWVTVRGWEIYYKSPHKESSTRTWCVCVCVYMMTFCILWKMITLPYRYEFNPQSYESHLRSKSFQHISVMSTRLLNARSQLSIGQGPYAEQGHYFCSETSCLEQNNPKAVSTKEFGFAFFTSWMRLDCGMFITLPVNKMYDLVFFFVDCLERGKIQKSWYRLKRFVVFFDLYYSSC